jgi:hypothetical protein
MYTVRVNGAPVDVIDRHTETTFTDRGHGLGALRVLTVDTPGTRYEGAFVMNPTSGDYSQRDRAQTADNLVVIEYPMPDGSSLWPRVMFADGSTVSAFMAPDPPPFHLRDCDPSPPHHAPPG